LPPACGASHGSGSGTFLPPATGGGATVSAAAHHGLSKTAGGGDPAATISTWNELYEYQRTAEPAAAAPTPKPTRSSAQHQYRILRHLDAMGVSSVPRPLYLNTDGTDISGHSVLVTSALGPSLSELLLFSGNQLSTRTVMTLALKLLMALADMHERDVVHGALTPSNIVMGRGVDRDKVYFINFNHARFYRDPKTHRAATNVVGAAVGAKRSHEYYCFCSTSVQRGCTPCPRDDVISVGYVLCYLTHGGVPWAGGDGQEQLDGPKLVRAKNQYMEALATTPPLQLFAFLKSAYALKQGDTPDYVYLCNLVRRMMRERGWSTEAPLDWDKRANL
jgi:tRNA A-37 threonylcarbamoyl transferase component Bud32